MKAALEYPPTNISNTDNLSINFVWIPAQKIPSGKLPIPNTENAPFIENIKQWKTLNSNVIVKNISLTLGKRFFGIKYAVVFLENIIAKRSMLYSI